MESSIHWLDPEGFGLTACVDETLQPMRWRVVAHDLLHSRPGPELPDPVQCESSTTINTVLFPPLQTVLAAGVVQNRGPRAATAPRSVVVTASTKFSHGINPCDTHQLLKIRDDNRCNDGQQHREAIHIWSLRIRRRLPGCAPTPAVPTCDKNPGPGKPNQAHYTSDRIHGQTGANIGSKPPGLTIILHEMTSMPIPQGASPAGIVCRSNGAGIGVRQQQQQEQQQGGGWNGTIGSTAAADGGSWRCSLAHTGAWAALQVSSARVLLINFEAALEPITIPCPHFPVPTPGVIGATSLSAVAAAAAGPGSSAIETIQHQMQSPHQNGTTTLRCLDLDLAAAVAATFGESSSYHLCQALSCYGYGDQVVLDVALAADAGGRANSDRDGNHPSSSADGNVEGHSVLLRISLSVKPVPNNCRSGSEDEPMDGVAKGGGGVAAPVGSKWGGAAATASVQLRGQISTCCQLHCLSESGSRRTRSGKTSPTMSGGTSAGAALQAPIDPPALVGVSARGHLYLITPYSPTAVTGGEMEAGERYPDKGALKGPQSSGLGPGGAEAAALSKQCQPPSPLPLAVVAQLLLPGPVISIHPLPRICTSAIFGISSAGAGGDPSGGGGCGIDGAQGCQGHPRHQAGSQQMARTATKAVFAAVLCSDTARSIAVLRIMCWQHSEDAQLAVRRSDATAAAGRRATGAASAGVPRSAVSADGPFRQWYFQQLLVVPGVQAILPVPLPSALSLALAPARSGCGRDKNDAGAEAVRADGFCSLGGDAVGVAVLVSPAAILILGRPPNGAERKGPAGRVDAGRTGHGLGDGVRRRGGDVWMRDMEEDEKMADEVAREPEHIEDSDDEWGGVYTQRQCLHPQHGGEWQQQPQEYGRTHQDEEAEAERGGGSGGGGLTALGPVGLGPWRRALILPAEVQPLPPQALLAPESATTSAAALPSAAAAAQFSAAGAVTGLLLIDPSCDTPHQDARQMQWGRPEQEQKHGPPGGLGSGDDGRSGVQDTGMAKVLAHMSRQWDAGVQRILEQRAALTRMVHLTREAEQLMADAGQQPLPGCGSAAARPPSRAALLDPLLDLEKEFLIQPQQRVRSRSAVSTRESAGPPAAGAGRGGGGDGDGDGDGTDMSAAVDRLLDQLLGCGGAGAAKVGNVPATVTAAAAARGRSESMPTAVHVPTVPAAGAKAGGGEGGSASEPQVPDNGSSWSPVLESLTQTRRAGNWVLRAVLRLEGGQEAGGGGRSAAVANADGNGRGGGSDNGRSAGDKRSPVASGQQRKPLTSPPPPLQLDDVALLPYCHAGLGLRNVLGRWEVLHRGSRRVAVEAAVPLGELLALASAAAATATPGGCLDAGSGADWELDSASRHLRDLQIALGPLPGLFEGPNDDGDDTVYSDGCSSDTNTDIEDACNLDDGGFPEHDENGGIGPRPMHDKSNISSRSTACKARELHLGAMVRITARVSSRPYLEESGGRIGGSTESSSAGLLQVRVLDVGRVIIPLHSLLQSGTNGNLAQRKQQQVEGGSKGASKAGAGDSHGGIGAVRQLPLGPATGLLLAPSRSLLLTATTGEAAGLEARMRTGAAPAAATGGGGGVPSCGSVPCGTGAPQWARSGGMCGDLWKRLLSEPGFRTPTEHESTGVRMSEIAEDDEDRPTCGQLLWEGPMGWRCVVSLQPCGVYGCEVELSYIDGNGSGWDSWSSAALDHVQQLVTDAAERSCEQVGRRLSLLCPNPLADSQLERMDIAAGALQRCVDATLELLEGALLAQQQQQLQQQQPRKQQQQNAARREVGTKPGLKDCTTGGVGTEAAISAGATGAHLQAMLQDVLQLQLQLHTAMETYLIT